MKKSTTQTIKRKRKESKYVYDPKTKTRMTLVYGVHKNQDQEDRTWSEKRLQEELQKTKELWLYEIYITDTTKTNTHEPIPKEVPNNKNINQTGGEPGNSIPIVNGTGVRLHAPGEMADTISTTVVFINYGNKVYYINQYANTK